MSGAEKIVEQVIETLNKNKGVDIVKIDLRRIENCFCSFPTRTWRACRITFTMKSTNTRGKNRYTWKGSNKHNGLFWTMETWSYIYFKKNKEIIINSKTFGWMQK